MVNDKVENPVLEQLRFLRAQSDRTLDEIRGVKFESVAPRRHIRGVELVQDRDHDAIVWSADWN